MPGEEIDPNANTPVHLEGTGPDDLPEEDGAAGKHASIEGDKVPRVELQETGVSHLTTPEDDMLLTTPGILESLNKKTVARIWNRRCTTRRCQTRAQNLPPTICLNRSGPPSMKKGRRSLSGAKNRGAQWVRRAQHQRAHPRARRPSEGRMAGLLTSPTRKRRAPPLGSRNLSTRRASAKPTRRRNATRTRANTNPVGRARAVTRGRPVHLARTRPWGPVGEQIIKSRGPIEANNKYDVATHDLTPILQFRLVISYQRYLRPQ